MPIGNENDKAFPPDHQEALFTASNEMVDECFEDIAALLVGADFADTSMADVLPPRYLSLYTPQFAKQFLTCILTVAWKLRAPGTHRLACVAEVLALAALIERATIVLEEQEKEADFSALEQVAYEDRALEVLFEATPNAIENTSAGKVNATANLRFDDWFTPFRAESPVHPYVQRPNDLF
jgi:hypothetical protein